MSRTGDMEAEIQEKNLTAPRVTQADVEASIRSEVYFTGEDAYLYATIKKGPAHVEGERILEPLECLTFCVLMLRNGLTVTGESACASPENFDAELGRKIARQNAVNKIRTLMGYDLKERPENS